MLAAVAAQMEMDSSAVDKAGLAGVKSVVGLIQERFADQASVPVQLVNLLLAQEKVPWYSVIVVMAYWQYLVDLLAACADTCCCGKCLALPRCLQQLKVATGMQSFPILCKPWQPSQVSNIALDWWSCFQVSEAAEQTALDICASEQTTEMLTQVQAAHWQPHWDQC